MDIYTIKSLLKKEKFTHETHETENPMCSDWISVVVSLLAAILAAKLSWGCSKMYSTILRAIFAFLAAMFGPTYIILFFIFRYDMCKRNLI